MSERNTNEREDVVRLTAEESERFAKLIVNPPSINEVMKTGLENYDRFFSRPENKTDLTD